LSIITKDDVFALFKTKVHPAGLKRAKLSVHVKSQKPRPPKVSNAAATVFEGLVRASGIAVKGSVSEWKNEFGTDAIPLSDFTKHWETVLGNGAETTELLEQIPIQMEAYPTEDSTEGTANASNAETIHNVAEFKSKLRVVDMPKPLVEWGDLPVAKF
jgi:insulysin